MNKRNYPADFASVDSIVVLKPPPEYALQFVCDVCRSDAEDDLDFFGFRVRLRVAEELVAEYRHIYTVCICRPCLEKIKGGPIPMPPDDEISIPEHPADKELNQ